MARFIRKTVDLYPENLEYIDKLCKQGLLNSYSHAMRFFVAYHQSKNKNLKYAHFKQCEKMGL